MKRPLQSAKAEIGPDPATFLSGDHCVGHLLIVTCVTLLCLLPFIGKPFHIDDPLFLWTAESIQRQPLNPENILVNWFGVEMPMSEVMRNPPLTSYYIAGVASALGWSEIALHGAFLLPALAAAAGTYLLARQLCQLPLLATLVSTISPVFMISATSVMSDVLMLALALWGTLVWCHGCRSEKRLLLLIGALLLSASILTKYLALGVVPLLLFWTWRSQKRVGWGMALLLIPILTLMLYFRMIAGISGTQSFVSALVNATSATAPDTTFSLSRLPVAIMFLGGCFVGVLFFIPFLVARWVWLAGVFALVGAVVIVRFTNVAAGVSLRQVTLADPMNAMYILLFATTGIVILVFAGYELGAKPGISMGVLSVWTITSIAFAMFVSWSISGRYLLPIMPAVGILLARAIGRRNLPAPEHRVLLPLIPAAIVVFVLAWSDYVLADSAREAAVRISRMPRPVGSTLWFEGHWGFQYYMARAGGKAIDMRSPALASGDRVVIPSNNTNTFSLSPEWVEGYKIIEPSAPPVATLMNYTIGAGFYTHVRGPLPFYIGTIPTEKYYVFNIREPSP